MPILAKESSLYPETLFDETPPDSEDRRWWAIYTMSRQEKSVARDLVAHEIPFYLPLMPKDNIIRSRRVRSHVPMFGGYVFLFGTPEERVTTLTTNRISRIFPVDDQQRLWDDLRNVNQMIELNVPLAVETRIAAGQKVRIKSGSLRGIEGTVVKRHSKCRLLVAVNYLQQGISVEIDDCAVEPV